MSYRPLKNLIIEIKSLIAGDAVYITEREIKGDAQGNITSATVEKDCPSAIRERLSMAHDIAAHNEKTMRDKMEVSKALMANAKEAGTDPSKYEADYNKYKNARAINLKNMGKLESIDSDYAKKFKPSDDKYEQRAHSMHLEKIQKRLTDRRKEAESATMPDYDRIDALDRRIGRVTDAQKESHAWLSTNDKNWLDVRQTAKIPTKDAVKDAEKKQKDEFREAEKAKKQAAKAAEKPGDTGSTVPTTGATTASMGTADTSAPDTAVTGTAIADKRAKVKAEGENRRFSAAPGEVWATATGFGAKNQTGSVGSKVGAKYFKDEASAKRHAEGKKPKDPAAALAPKKKPTAKKKLTDSLITNFVGNRLRTLSEKDMTTNPTLSESATVKEMKQGIKDLIDLIKMHEKLAYEAKKAKNPEVAQMHRDHIAEFSHDIQTTKDMIARALTMKEAVQSIMVSSLKKKLMTEAVIEYDLDGKSLDDVVAFLDNQDIDYCVKDGIVFVSDDEEEETEEELEEAAARRKIVIRKGRKKIIFKCAPGKMKVGRSCMVRKMSQRIKLSKAHRIGARKAKSKKSRSSRLRKRSNLKRSALGLD